MGLESASPIFIADLNVLWPLGGDQRSTSDDHQRLIKAALKNTLPELSATVSANPAELNLLSGFAGVIPSHGVEHDWTAQQYFAEASLTDSATVSWDLSVAQTARWAIGGARVLIDPSNMKAGATYVLRITNQLSSTASISFGAAFLWPGGGKPTLTKSLSAVDIISFYCTGTNMLGTAILDYK